MEYKTVNRICFSFFIVAITTLTGCISLGVNRSDPESVAEAVVTGIANKDVVFLEELTLPESRKELQEEINENGFPVIQSDLRIRTEISERTEDTVTVRILDTDLLFTMKYQDNQWWFER